jgi:hypothetical protein
MNENKIKKNIFFIAILILPNLFIASNTNIFFEKKDYLTHLYSENIFDSIKELKTFCNKQYPINNINNTMDPVELFFNTLKHEEIHYSKGYQTKQCPKSLNVTMQQKNSSFSATGNTLNVFYGKNIHQPKKRYINNLLTPHAFCDFNDTQCQKTRDNSLYDINTTEYPSDIEFAIKNLEGISREILLEVFNPITTMFKKDIIQNVNHICLKKYNNLIKKNPTYKNDILLQCQRPYLITEIFKNNILKYQNPLKQKKININVDGIKKIINNNYNIFTVMYPSKKMQKNNTYKKHICLGSNFEEDLYNNYQKLLYNKNPKLKDSSVEGLILKELKNRNYMINEIKIIINQNEQGLCIHFDSKKQ